MRLLGFPLYLAKDQWQPTVGVHDPNPPLSLENPPLYVGQAVRTVGPALPFQASPRGQTVIAVASASTGDLTNTLDAVTLSAGATLALQGSLTATLGNVTLSGAATLALQGSLTATLGAVTLSATGALSIQASLTATLANVTLTSDGTVAQPVIGNIPRQRTPWMPFEPAPRGFTTQALSGLNGDLTVTLNGVTLSGAAALAIQGSATPTLDAVTLSSSGVVALQGTVSATLGPVTLSSAGALDLQGSLTTTLAAVTLSSDGSVAQLSVGMISRQVGPWLPFQSAPRGFTVPATVGSLGDVSAGLAGVTLSSDGTVAQPKVGQSTRQNFGPAMDFAPAPRGFTTAAQASGTGDLTATLTGVGLSASGTLAIQGSLTATLNALTLSSAAVLALQGSLSATLGAVTLSATGSSTAQGDLTVTLGAVTLSSAAVLALQGTVTTTLASTTLSSGGALALSGAVGVTLGAVTLNSAGGLAIQATLSKILGTLTLSASGANSDFVGATAHHSVGLHRPSSVEVNKGRSTSSVNAGGRSTQVNE